MVRFPILDNDRCAQALVLQWRKNPKRIMIAASMSRPMLAWDHMYSFIIAFWRTYVGPCVEVRPLVKWGQTTKILYHSASSILEMSHFKRGWPKQRFYERVSWRQATSSNPGSSLVFKFRARFILSMDLTYTAHTTQFINLLLSIWRRKEPWLDHDQMVNRPSFLDS